MKGWLQSRNHHVVEVTLIPLSKGRLHRFVLSTVLGPFVLLRKTQPRDQVFLLGLGEIHVQMLASFLSVFRREVVFDVCDSWLLQWRARRKLSGASSLLSLAGAVGLFLAPASMGLSYISTRDLDSDRRLVRSRFAFVVPPVAPVSLRNLPNIQTGPISRLVVVADLRSFHNAIGFESLMKAWPEVIRVRPRARLHVFGLNLPSQRIPGVVAKGWVANIDEIYCGNSAVFVTNVEGSGVPNKLVEAVVARRPLVIHESLKPLVEDGPWVFCYQDSALSTLCRLFSTSFEAKPEVFPRLSEDLEE